MKTAEFTSLWSPRSKMMLAFLLVRVLAVPAQQLYDNFEGTTVVNYYVNKRVQLETQAPNPAPDKVNSSSKCARFARAHQRYDYVKIYPEIKLESVDLYATYDFNAPRLKMKVFTTAAAGSTVEIQLGKKEGNAYPEGVHSQYQAITTVSGVWEELEFRYAVSPKGSETKAHQVDQLTLLFNPNTNSTDVWYFDDIEGPLLSNAPSARAHHRKFWKD